MWCNELGVIWDKEAWHWDFAVLVGDTHQEGGPVEVVVGQECIVACEGIELYQREVTRNVSTKGGNVDGVFGLMVVDDNGGTTTDWVLVFLSETVKAIANSLEVIFFFHLVELEGDME